MKKRSIRDIEIEGARVLLRTDYEVEVYADQVLDDRPLRASLPTIRELRSAGARIAICAPRGNPEGHAHPEFRSQPLADRLAELLGAPVTVVPDSVGEAAENAVRELPPGGVLLLENVRFHAGEEANDPEFARALARVADVFVNDAFADLEFEHASVVGVPEHLPAAAGLLVEREVEALSAVTMGAARPSALVLGGVKVEKKLQLVESLLPHLDVLCLGGLFGISVLQAAGIEIPGLELDAETEQRIDTLLESLRSRPEVRLVVPPTVVATDGAMRTLSLSPLQIPEGWRVMDIATETIRAFEQALRGSHTVVWNGPLGLYQEEPFARGTFAIAEILAALPAHTIGAGGETATVIRRAGVGSDFAHVSTGGTAALRLLAGLSLPGLDALPDSTNA